MAQTDTTDAATDADAATDDEEAAAVAVFHTVFGDHRTDDTARLAADIRHEIGFTDDRETVTPEEFREAYTYAGSDTAASLQAVWERWNAGDAPSRAFIEAETRSLCVGDVVRFDGDAYICASVGWDRAPGLDDVTAAAAEAEEVR